MSLVLAFSTRNMLTSCRPGPVLAYTRKMSPVVTPSAVPFVIHIFAPSILKEDPSADAVALVVMPNTSVPEHGDSAHKHTYTHTRARHNVDPIWQARRISCRKSQASMCFCAQTDVRTCTSRSLLM